MGFNIGELVQSTKYRKFIQYLYGWGASIVLLGAAALAGGGIDADAGYVGGSGDIFLFRL